MQECHPNLSSHRPYIHKGVTTIPRTTIFVLDRDFDQIFLTFDRSILSKKYSGLTVDYGKYSKLTVDFSFHYYYRADCTAGGGSDTN